MARRLLLAASDVKADRCESLVGSVVVICKRRKGRKNDRVCLGVHPDRCTHAYIGSIRRPERAAKEGERARERRPCLCALSRHDDIVHRGGWVGISQGRQD
eukprot:6212439-Pleurochrysis_carterae.AAC.1